MKVVEKMPLQVNFQKKQEDGELCVFPGETINFTEICSSKKNLHTLIIIGQSGVSSLEGISNLIHLRELWVVECEIKETKDFEKCGNLEKIYLYSNQIDEIPNLVKNKLLSILNLAGNVINRIKNIRGLTNLQELNLANNDIKRLLDVFPKNGHLKSVNFSGNPLYALKDLQSLSEQKNLESIVFADPLYGECPVVHICYYRYHVINFLPDLKELDHYIVTNEEKCLANNFIRENQILYNVLWHSALNDFLTMQKHKYNDYYQKISIFRKKLEIDNCKDKFQNQNYNEIRDFTKIRKQNLEIVEWGKKELEKLQVFHHQLKLKFQYSGNIDFKECEEKIMKTCKSILDDSLCPIAKNVGIKGVVLTRVTKIKNNGIKAFYNFIISNSESTDFVFLILVSPFGVCGMNKWPFLPLEHFFFNEKKICVSNCLAPADNFWLEEFLSEKCNLRKYEKSLETRVCILVQIPLLLMNNENSNFKNLHVDNGTKCQKFILENVEKVIPVFVIEYKYQFEDNFITSPIVDKNSSFLININSQLKINKELTNLTILNLSHQGLSKLNLTFENSNLQELNLSHNQLTEFPDKRFLQNLKILNLSFNRIELLDIEENFDNLQHLDISWNYLTRYLQSMENLGNFCSNLKELNLDFNPFKDIFHPDFRASVTKNFLKNLTILDGCKIQDFLGSRKYLSNFEKNSKDTNAIYRVNEGLRKIKIDEFSSRAKRINISGNLIKNLKFVEKFPDLQELYIQNNILTEIDMKIVKNLVKLNLSGNFIKSLKGLEKENLPSLQYLDLSNNQISSFFEIRSHEKLKEFYCYQNQISELAELLNLRNWTELKVVDFSGNKLTDPLWKTFILFYLRNIKYINGDMVKESEIQNAEEEFSESLNKMTLMTSRAFNEFSNLKELSIVNCSIKKVNLPGDFLPFLESLDLRKNQISNLWGLHFLPKLKTLCLSYNRIEFFQNPDSENNDISATFPELITLYLDNNRIRTLQKLMLKNCPKLQHLFLQYNQLQDIDGLQQLENLETLILDYNEIKTIKVENFHLSNKINFLFLENNRLNFLGFVKNLHCLETLLVANNKIEYQSYLNELAPLKKLRELSIFGNPFCRKSKNHYKFVLTIFEDLSLLDGIDVSKLRFQ